ncbi:MAG: DUF4190 domain-containing protein [Tepidisphaeraceae bacterium]|jgi:hypothetical protein
MSQYSSVTPPNPPVSIPFPPPAAKTSGLAVASLVCSLILCIPLLGLVGAILGIAALGATKRPGVRGRGLAIGGIIVGIMVTFMWIAGVIGTVAGFKQISGVADQPVTAFIADYNKGNDRAIYDAASADFRKSVSYVNLHEILEAARTQWGTCSRMGTWEMMTGGGFNVNINNDRMEANLPLRFAKAGPRKVDWTFRKENGKWLMISVRFESLTYDTTQPVER